MLTHARSSSRAKPNLWACPRAPVEVAAYPAAARAPDGQCCPRRRLRAACAATPRLGPCAPPSAPGHDEPLHSFRTAAEARRPLRAVDAARAGPRCAVAGPSDEATRARLPRRCRAERRRRVAPLTAPRHVEAHIRFLQKRGFQVLTAELLDGALRANGSTDFDDGFRNWVIAAQPLLERLGVRGTFYLCPGRYRMQQPEVAGEQGRLLDEAEAPPWRSRGWSSSHSADAPDAQARRRRARARGAGPRSPSRASPDGPAAPSPTRTVSTTSA